MNKKKFSLSTDFVKIDKEEKLREGNDLENKKENKRYTGPHSKRVPFSTSIDESLRNDFKVWVAKKQSNFATEIEKAIKKLMEEN